VAVPKKKVVPPGMPGGKPGPSKGGSSVVEQPRTPPADRGTIVMPVRTNVDYTRKMPRGKAGGLSGPPSPKGKGPTRPPVKRK